MKRSRFTDQQIAFALQQAEQGTQVAEVTRKMGCEWKSNMVPVVAIQNGPTCFNATLTG